MIGALPLLATAACTGPLAIVGTHGAAADREATLGWVLSLISAAVVVMVSVLLVAALVRRRADPSLAVRHEGSGTTWILIGGVAFPAVVLVAAFIFTMSTLAAVSAPARMPAADIEVIGHRWWWEVRYRSGTASRAFVAANEIHVPVGRPVRLELSSADVIHSFWVPQLAGKTDLIPGQRNVMWLEADTAGVYGARCAEYCGLEHARMALVVVADSPGEFDAWLAEQREPAQPPSDPAAAAGLAVFRHSTCAACHAIRGTDVLAKVGPDLTHLASRRTLAAGTLPNTRGNLAGWVANAQAIKPGNLMPTMYLSPAELQALVAYLETLR